MHHVVLPPPPSSHCPPELRVLRFPYRRRHRHKEIYSTLQTTPEAAATSNKQHQTQRTTSSLSNHPHPSQALPSTAFWSQQTITGAPRMYPRIHLFLLSKYSGTLLFYDMMATKCTARHQHKLQPDFLQKYSERVQSYHLQHRTSTADISSNTVSWGAFVAPPFVPLPCQQGTTVVRLSYGPTDRHYLPVSSSAARRKACFSTAFALNCAKKSGGGP